MPRFLVDRLPVFFIAVLVVVPALFVTCSDLRWESKALEGGAHAIAVDSTAQKLWIQLAPPDGRKIDEVRISSTRDRSLARRSDERPSSDGADATASEAADAEIGGAPLVGAGLPPFEVSCSGSERISFPGVPDSATCGVGYVECRHADDFSELTLILGPRNDCGDRIEYFDTLYLTAVDEYQYDSDTRGEFLIENLSIESVGRAESDDESIAKIAANDCGLGFLDAWRAGDERSERCDLAATMLRHSSLRRVRDPQGALANLAMRAPQFVSPTALLFLCGSTVFLAILLLVELIRLWLPGSFAGAKADSRRNAGNLLHVDEVGLRRREFLQFFEVTGPAVGFGLTVIALTIAFHRLVTASSAMGNFFDAVSLATISTALGITVRILAYAVRWVIRLRHLAAADEFNTVNTRSPDDA